MFRRATTSTASITRRPAARARRSFVPTCVSQNSLEARQVLTTASLSPAGVLTLTGTRGPDTINVVQDGAKILTGAGFFATSVVKSIMVDALDGDDSINVVTSIPATINGGTGTNTYSNVPDTDIIIDSTLTSGVAMSKAVMDKFQSLNGAAGFLGQPVGDEVAAYGGRVIYFQGGQIDYSTTTGAHEVHGLISRELNNTYSETDANGSTIRPILGLATSDETDGLGGRVSHFRGGDIYYSAATGAHAVIGAIAAEYAATANETDAVGVSVQKILGLPTSAETNVPGIAGARMQTFQGGKIYWSVKTGAHALYGAIGAYGANGPVSVLGLPMSDEQGPPTHRTVHFEHGYIAWSPTTGARILVQ